jgi:uncharacterized membrane protein YfcA
MKLRKCKYGSIMLLPLLFSLSGCKSRDDALYAYGTLAFLIYILLVFCSVAFHHWHSRQWFQNVRVKCRKFILPLSFLGIPAGILVALGSVGTQGLSRLGIFIGTLISLVFYSLQQWSKSDQVEKQRLYMKLVQLSFSFLVVLVYLYFGGRGLK